MSMAASIPEKAAELFLSGYNCAQSIYAAFAPQLGISEKQAAKMASALGGGLCRMRETCGAISGGMMVLGALKGYDTPDDEAKKILYARGQRIMKQFKESFEIIRTHFDVVFKALFGGGTGKLSLSDPDNVLESGIDIKAAPPGKIVKSLSLLSGGEQSFVAIALLFAVLKVNPSPFCIFDEIESALDEVNVARFAEYIKNFSEETQFILITHRRGTMEEADTLYGITMQEKGVSDFIRLDAASSEKYASDGK